MASRTVQTCAAAIVLLIAVAGHAQLPTSMNYQVMLTDNEDTPLADQLVTLEFRLYELEAGGTPVWGEIQYVTTNAIGVVSVEVGSANPITYYSFGPTWLEVEVNGEVMTPRRPLLSAPYAKVAGEAGHAFDSDELAMVPAEEYALYDALSLPGTLNNPSNPLEWTRLKNVPAGFADGIDNTGPGDGHSLDAVDGSPVDVVYVDDSGVVSMGTGAPLLGSEGAVELAAPIDKTGLFITADSDLWYTSGAFIHSSACAGLVVNTDFPTNTTSWPSQGTAIAGLVNGDGIAGYFSAAGPGTGIYCRSDQGGSALFSRALGTGYSGEFEGGSGVLMTRDDTYPVLRVENERTGYFGDAGQFLSTDGSWASTYTLYSECYLGEAGRFRKQTDNHEYALTVHAASPAAEGLYVYGYIFSESLAARGVQTSRGTEAVFGVTAENVEIMASGQGKLSGGEARVPFSRLFSESMGDPSELRVTVTPVGGWSAIYVANWDRTGFDLRSEAGDADIEFHWVAVAPDGGHERRPAVTIPDHEEDERIERLKMAELEAKRPPRTRRQEPRVVTR